MPSAFYFEIFNDNSLKRLHSINGVSIFSRVHLPGFLQEETKTGKPISISDINLLCFNPKIRSETWKTGEEEADALNNYRRRFINPLADVYNSLKGKHPVGFSRNEISAINGTENDFKTLCNKLQDPIRIREIAAFSNFSHAKIIDSSWLHFRFAQAFALLLLVQERRYPNKGDKRSAEHLTHEILDQEYLILGLQVGRLATKEISTKRPFSTMAWKYLTLAPDHLLVTK